jgi:hypothetical protein
MCVYSNPENLTSGPVFTNISDPYIWIKIKFLDQFSDQDQSWCSQRITIKSDPKIWIKLIHILILVFSWINLKINPTIHSEKWLTLCHDSDGCAI